MTRTTLAAAILRDVPKDALAKIVYDAMRFERQNDTPDWADGGNSCAQTVARHAAAKVQDAVLAALTAAMDPAIAERAGEVAKRLDAVSLDVGYSSTTTLDSGVVRQAADMLTAILAQNAALRAERDRYLRHLTAGAESLNAYKARAEAAEAQIAALTARVKRLTGAAAKAERIIANGQPDKIADAGAILRATLSTATEEGHE